MKSDSHLTVNITEFKKDPIAILKRVKRKSVAIVNRKTSVAYLVPAKLFSTMLNKLEDYELAKIVKRRQKQKDRAIPVSLDDL